MKKVFLIFCLFCAALSWGACGNMNASFTISTFQSTGVWGYDACILRCSEAPECPSSFQYNGWTYYNANDKFLASSQNIDTYSCISNSGAMGWSQCYNSGVQVRCNYNRACNSQAEADSARCELDPSADGCAPSCDSTYWECSTNVEHSQTTIASDNVQCFGGDCYGGVYCEYVSESTTECRSDCGEITTQTSRVPIRYEGACNPDNLTDDTECSGVRCMSFEKTGAYTLYKLCKSREIVNGERKLFPRMIGGGKGTCKNAGYPESNGDSTAFSGSSADSASIPESCFTFGIDCPSPDDTDYNDSQNRTPQNNCQCEKLDGMDYISRIVCPDGSVTAFYGSCDEWRASSNSSSSVPPESSSSGSENPPTSSGGELVGDWTTYEQGEDIKGILGVIAMNTAKEQQINNINSVNVALDDYTASISDSAAALVVPDSMYNPQYFIDSLGLADSIFKRVTEQNTILDTLEHPVAACPCITFFGGNGLTSSTENGRLRIQEISFDFSDFHGFNLCRIISVIVTALASVVAFFIGFAIFKNVSQ